MTGSQKARLEKALEILRAATGRRMSRGESVAALADFALRHRALLAKSKGELAQSRDRDPFFDATLVFDVGRTDERTHDRTLYGGR